MKPQYFLALLLLASTYLLYMLYKPFWMSITIAALLAMSTTNINKYFKKKTNSNMLGAMITSLLLAILFFVPLSYFLTTLTLQINQIDSQILQQVYNEANAWLQDTPIWLEPAKPYLKEALDGLSLSNVATNAITITAQLGSYSAAFLKSAFLVIIFYFFAHYYGERIVEFLKRVIKMSAQDTTLLTRELSSVMGVVFYSIITTAAFEGALFGIAISFLGYNGLLFGIMYGFASLIPVVGGILMWLPFMLFELALGHTANAVFITIYSIVVISIIADTFVKPFIIKEINVRFIKSSTYMNEMLIFFSIIAGLATFGFWGMILGPAITSFFLALLKLIEQKNITENSNT